MQELQQGGYKRTGILKDNGISGMCLNHTIQIKKKSQRVLGTIDQNWVWEIFECQQIWIWVYEV